MSVFDRYRRPEREQDTERQPVASPPSDAPSPTPNTTAERDGQYLAYTHEPTNKRSPARLRIDYGDGGVALMSYAYLMEVYCPSHQHLSLIFTNVVITLKGHHLDQILEPLQESKVRTIVCFNPVRYEQPEAGTPLINTIKRESLQEAARAVKPTTTAKS